MPSSSSTYKGGRILRVKLENFMTYDKLELVAGSGLNMIVGPNGSGKSSIICAICLGLAGKATWTGRLLRLSEFIKHGCKEAYIKIHLDDPESKYGVLRITRRITHNQSEFRINNVPVKEAQVEKVVSRFNIQVNNMCQFLPQEKVSEFSKMSPKQLLESVHQTVGDEKMQKAYAELLELRQKGRELEGELAERKENLDNDKKSYERLVPEYKTEMSRQDMLKQVEMMKEKEEALLYFDLYKKLKQREAEYKEVEKQIKDFEEKQIDGLKNELDSTKQEIRGYSNLLSLLRSDLRKANCAVESSVSQLRHLDNKIYELKEAFENKKGGCKNLEKTIEDMKLQKAAFEEHYDNLLAKKNQMEQEQKANEERIIQNLREKVDMEARIADTDYEFKHWDQEEKRLNAELLRYRDIENRKNEMLKRYYKDTYEAKCWLESNLHRFKRKIIGPLMILINIPNPENIKYLEAHIPQRDMVLFLCEHKEDAKLFTKILRVEKRLAINAACVATKPVTDYSPLRPEALNRFKFHAFLKDLFEAPDAVKSFLCEKYSVHNTPVGNDETERFMQNEGQDSITKMPYTRFYTPTTSYSIKRSRYGARLASCYTTQISDRGFLSKFVSSSENERRVIEQKLMEVQQQKDRLRQEKINLESQVVELNIRVEQHRKSQQKLINVKEELKKTKQQIDQRQRNINKYEEELRNFDLQAAERKYERDITIFKNRKMRELENIQVHLKECFEISQKKCKVCFYEASALGKSNKIEALIEGKHRELGHFREDLEEKKSNYRAAKAAASRQMAKAAEVTGMDFTSPNRKAVYCETQFFTVFLKKYGGISNIYEEVVNTRIALESKIACMSETDQSVMENCRKLEKKIKRDERSLQELEDSLNHIYESLQSKKAEWLQPLEDMISIISRKFSYYFKEMGCVGEISLNKSENEDDIDKYGLSILVKFRDSAELRELSSAHHSGGECSVTTMIFILSLQELVEVPFRCVDEINQGMDPINERKIFEFVSSTAEDSSQYFLLTPKLLHDLPYSPEMKVHIVHNGPCLEYLKWDLEAILAEENGR